MWTISEGSCTWARQEGNMGRSCIAENSKISCILRMYHIWSLLSLHCRRHYMPLVTLLSSSTATKTTSSSSPPHHCCRCLLLPRAPVPPVSAPVPPLTSAPLPLPLPPPPPPPPRRRRHCYCNVVVVLSYCRIKVDIYSLLLFLFILLPTLLKTQYEKVFLNIYIFTIISLL